MGDLFKRGSQCDPLKHTVHWEGREHWGNQGCCFAAALIVPTSSSLERKPSEGTSEERVQ